MVVSPRNGIYLEHTGAMAGEEGKPSDGSTDMERRMSETAEPLRLENGVIRDTSSGLGAEESWASVWRHFGQNTTFHGVNKVVESPEDSRGFPFRRLV